jgi:RsiW-degrading membrane proteinase PrsW (M82 family)
MIIYATLLVCALLAGVLVYRYDLYDREPVLLLLVVAAVGGALMYIAGWVQVMVLSSMGTLAAQNFNLWAALAAAVTEETAKVLAVVFIAVVFRRHFNDPMDGLIYGSLAGVGCAVEEAVGVLLRDGGAMAPGEAPVRIMGHLVMGGIGGFALGLPLARPRPKMWAMAVVGSLGTAAALHMLWDLIAFDARDLGRMMPGHQAGAVALMLAGMVIYGGMVVAASGMSRRTLDPASRRRLLGWPFVRDGGGSAPDAR